MSVDTLKIKLDIPCIQGQFDGQLVTYTTQVAPGDIVNLLGHDPRSKSWSRLPAELKDIYHYLQRKTSKDRRESIAGYIEERFGPDPIAIGAFPAISIAVTRPTIFRPYDETGDLRINKAVGQLEIDLSVSNTRILLDGLGRVAGALDLIDEGKSNIVSTFQFPVTIFAPHPNLGKDLSWRQMGQLFHDFNYRVHPVSRHIAIALDTSDLYIALANKLAQAPFIRDNGGVAERAASLGKKSTELVVQSVLVRMVRGACEGQSFQESNLGYIENGNLNRDSLQTLKESIERFFSEFAKRMGTRFTDRNSIHLAAPGWQALGVVHNDIVFQLKMEDKDRDSVLDRIAAIGWSRTNPDWVSMGLGVVEIDKKTNEPVLDEMSKPRIVLSGAGRSNIHRILTYVREKAGYASRITNTEKDAESAIL